jgi:hypothetical protein
MRTHLPIGGWSAGLQEQRGVLFKAAEIAHLSGSDHVFLFDAQSTNIVSLVITSFPRPNLARRRDDNVISPHLEIHLLVRREQYRILPSSPLNEIYHGVPWAISQAARYKLYPHINLNHPNLSVPQVERKIRTLAPGAYRPPTTNHLPSLGQFWHDDWSTFVLRDANAVWKHTPSTGRNERRRRCGSQTPARSKAAHPCPAPNDGSLRPIMSLPGLGPRQWSHAGGLR